MAMSNDKKLLAVGEGKPNKQGQSYIYLYDTTTKELIQKLTFH